MNFLSKFFLEFRTVRDPTRLSNYLLGPNQINRLNRCCNPFRGLKVLFADKRDPFLCPKFVTLCALFCGSLLPWYSSSLHWNISIFLLVLVQWSRLERINLSQSLKMLLKSSVCLNFERACKKNESQETYSIVRIDIK